MTRRLGGVAITVVGLVIATASAAGAAGGGRLPAKCLVTNRNGDLPDCVWDGHAWQVQYPAATTGTPGGGAFAALLVLGVLVSVGLLVWRLSLARSMARRSGMNPGEATAVTLLTDDGLEATYLASALRPTASGAVAPAAPTAVPPDAEVTDPAHRLRRLDELRRDGLVTEEEYAARRQAIIDSI